MPSDATRERLTRLLRRLPRARGSAGRRAGPRRDERRACALALATGALLLAAAPVASGRVSGAVALDVTFSATGTISVTLADGTPVGSSSGAPTMIPAGYYTLELSGPGGCTELPLFELKGPGEDIFENMTEGELDYTTANAYLAPNSTYTWRNYSTPAVTYTFVTSNQVVGSAPPAPTPSVYSGTVASRDVVGSAAATASAAGGGALSGAVSASGRLSLDFHGTPVASLKAGRYTITVTTASATHGFLLDKLHARPLTITRAGFVGRQSATVELTAGQWYFSPVRSGPKTYFLVTTA